MIINEFGICYILNVFVSRLRGMFFRTWSEHHCDGQRINVMVRESGGGGGGKENVTVSKIALYLYGIFVWYGGSKNPKFCATSFLNSPFSIYLLTTAVTVSNISEFV